MAHLNKITLESLRLLITPLNLEQLSVYKKPDALLECDLGLFKIKRKLSEEFLFTIENSAIPYIDKHPEDILFGTLWIIIHKMTKEIIGDIGFKGKPSDKGLIEIGYGTYPEFSNQGYMTEALGVMATWAFKQPTVRIILADTNKENISSQKILSKNNFSVFAETEHNYWWRLDKDVGEII